MSVIIIYGSDGGTTRKIAKTIATKTGGAAIDICKAELSDFERASLLILGCPTYGEGELQSDWVQHGNKLTQADLKGRRVAIFGTGDQDIYTDSFVDAIGILHDMALKRGAEIVGQTDAAGYQFNRSGGCKNGCFLGLALDDDNQPDLTDQRIDTWLEQIQ